MLLLPTGLKATWNRQPLKAIKYLVETNPDALKVPNDDGLLPLHQCWMRNGASAENLDARKDRLVYLVQQNPQTLYYQWRYGSPDEEQTLLHKELSFRRTNGSSFVGLRFLLEHLYYPTDDPCCHINNIQPDPMRFVVNDMGHKDRSELQVGLLKILPDTLPKEALWENERVQQQ